MAASPATSDIRQASTASLEPTTVGASRWRFLFTAWGAAGLTAPLAAGALHDLTGGYAAALLVAAGLSVASAVIGWRLIPTANLGDNGNSNYFELADYVAEMTVPEKSTLIGQRIRDLDEETEKADVLIIGLIRDGRRLFGNVHNRIINAGDSLVIEANPDALDEFRTALKLVLGDKESGEKAIAAGAGQGLLEPLFAVYRRTVARAMHDVLAAGNAKVRDIFDRCAVNYLDLPDTQHPTNLNTRQEYDAYIEKEQCRGEAY